MERKKYFYNPKTLSFVEEKYSWKDRMMKSFGFGAAVLFTAFILLLISSQYITTPKEKKLKNQLENVNYDLEAISYEITALNQDIDKIQERDAYVHRVILGKDPIDESLWKSGIGGSRKYTNYMSFDDSKIMIKETLERIEMLKRKVDLQTSSLDTLERLAIRRADKLASIPSIKPVREDKLRNKISYLSGYGWRIHPVYKIKRFHSGIDFTAPSGTPIQATGKGVVSKVVRQRTGYGNYVIIDHGFGYQSLYAHLSKINIKEGEKVVRGQSIGLIGNTGTSTAPHVHYEVRINGKPVNPIDYIYDGMTPKEYQLFVEKASVENQSLD
jgi:murein DD-endopeptidase MepM/ murein hydrolase activator NlpD